MNFSLFYFLFDATRDKVFLTINIYQIISSQLLFEEMKGLQSAPYSMQTGLTQMVNPA